MLVGIAGGVGRSTIVVQTQLIVDVLCLALSGGINGVHWRVGGIPLRVHRSVWKVVHWTGSKCVAALH